MQLSEMIKKIAPEFGFLSEDNKNIEQDVINKLDKSVKFDEIDTTTFGIETDDGKIVKVYVKADQADDFEKALSEKLGEIDDIEEVINSLSKDFEIVDVEWPSEKEISDVESDEDTGKDVLDPKVYQNSKERAEIENEMNPKFEQLSDEELELLEDNESSIESRFTTATQLMIYHAILDLGIPEIALLRSPYRPQIVKGIKNKAFEMMKNSSLRNSLKIFINRNIDFDEKAKENEKTDVKEAHIVEDAGAWNFSMDNDVLTISNSMLKISLDAEETEKMVKGISNHDAVVVKDVEDVKKKIVFSPRGSSLVIKQIGTTNLITMSSKDVDDLLDTITLEKVAESIDTTKSLIDNLEKFSGIKIKPGRNVIKGYPVEIEDSDGTYIDMTVVDKAACTGLVKELRSAGFKAKRKGDKGISIQ